MIMTSESSVLEDSSCYMLPVNILFLEKADPSLVSIKL